MQEYAETKAKGATFGLGFGLHLKAHPSRIWQQKGFEDLTCGSGSQILSSISSKALGGKRWWLFYLVMV